MTLHPVSERKNQPRAAIVIPHFNDVARLETCLAALLPQLVDAPVEVVVVDNGSTQDMNTVRGRFPAVHFLEEPEKGAAAARNTGVAATDAAHLFFIDADCIPAPDWVATALALAGTDRIVGGRVAVFDETPPPRSGAEAFETVFAFPQRDYVERKSFSVTANLLTSRRVFDDTGPFDRNVAEDFDWCQRAVARGWPIVFDDALHVAHPTRNDWAALQRKWRRTTSEAYFSNGTTPLRRLRWGARALVVLASGVFHIPRIIAHPDLKGVERLRGIAVLVRVRILRALWMLRQAVFGETTRSG